MTEEELLNQSENPPRGEWCYGYAVCRSCVKSPHPEPWMIYYIDDDGRCYCRDCSPVTPDFDDDAVQSGLEEWSK